MHKVGASRTFLVSFFVASALNYLAAFNMVGWNFLLPGQYTFGIASSIFLVAISFAVLLWVADVKLVELVIAGGGFALALLAISSLIATGAIPLKDYFIWGFVVAVPVAVFAAALLVHLRRTIDSIRVSRALVRAASLWALTLLTYVISLLFDFMPDLQRFHRQQIYLLGAAAIAAGVLLQISKILRRKLS